MSTVSGSTSSPSIWTLSSPTSGQDANLADTATAMSIEAAVVGSLGGSSVVSLSASSLLDRLVSANEQSQQLLAPTAPASTAPAATSGTTPDGTTAGSDTNAGDSRSTDPVYDASGALQNLGNTDANWAKVLQSNPELAPDAIQALIGQGIINTLA